MIVDDNAVNRRVLQVQLTTWGIRNESVASGEEALRQLRLAHVADDPYQLALLDHHMPGMDGETLGLAIKADAALVLLTSTG